MWICASLPRLRIWHRSLAPLSNRARLEAILELDLTTPPVIVANHPVTLISDAGAEVDALFAALENLKGPVVFCYPNADTGHQIIIDRARDHCRRKPHARLNTNLDLFDFRRLLKIADFMIGNSSSGIMETPSLKIPFINIGLRQRGRERATNVIDVPGERAAIVRAIEKARSPSFRASLTGMINPYGDGNAARRIAATIRTCPLGDTLPVKRSFPI